MPGIGSLIREIAVQISEMLENKQTLLSKTKLRVLSDKELYSIYIPPTPPLKRNVGSSVLRW